MRTRKGRYHCGLLFKEQEVNVRKKKKVTVDLGASNVLSVLISVNLTFKIGQEQCT